MITAAPRGPTVSTLRSAPALSGETHRAAPEASRRCRENPMGAAGLLQTRRFRSGQTLRRRRRRLPFTGGLRCVKPREGDRGDAGRRDAAGWSASEGGAPGPRQGGVTTPAPGRRSSSDPASRCLSPYVLRAWGAETSWQGIASGATASCQRRLPSRRQAPEAASEQQQNPMDGSGPRDREAGGEQTVGEVRNLVDGVSRGRHPRVIRTRQPMSSKGNRTPGGEVSAVRPGPGPRNSALRRAQACGSRFGSSSLAGRRVRSRPADGTPRGRTSRRGGCGEPMSPLRRTEWSSGRQGDLERVA